MATYFWRGLTAVGPTGYEWGNTANWRTSLTDSAAPAVFPKGGDTVIFGATAIGCCLVGGLSGGVWIGYASGDADAATDITVFVERGYGATLPNTTDLTQLGYSFGSITGGLNLKVNKLFIGTNKNNAEISIKNIPASSYSSVLMDGQTATFFASGQWTEIEVERGSLKTESLTAKNILIQGFQGTRGVTYFTAATAGFGVAKIELNGPSDIGSVIFTTKATKEQSVVNVPTKSPITNAMGMTMEGFTYTSVIQNVRPAGLEKEYNRITKTLRYKR